LSGMVAVIVSRTTYTVDVLYSFFISLFVWKFYHMALSLPTERRNRVMKWLEKGAVATDADHNRELVSPKGKFVELDDSINMNSPVTKRYQELNESKTSSPVASRFIELTTASPGPSYKELSCVIK